MGREFSPMEKHFLRWYEDNKDTFSRRVHRFLSPNCKRCKSSEELKTELDEVQET